MADKLWINKEFKNYFLKKPDALNKLGFNNFDEYMKKIIIEINLKFNFLNIVDYNIFDSKELHNKYYTYNGYIESSIEEYNEIIISFSEPISKLGDTIINQQLMPMIFSKLNDNYKFLIDKKVLRIFIYTSFINSSFSINEKISTLQVQITSLNNLNFHIIPIIKIENLIINKKYTSPTDFLNDIEVLRISKKNNNQSKYLDISSDGKFKYDIDSNVLQGNFLKIFLLEVLTLAIISVGKKYNYNIIELKTILKNSDRYNGILKFLNYLENNDEKVKTELDFKEVESNYYSLNIDQNLNENNDINSNEKILNDIDSFFSVNLDSFKPDIVNFIKKEIPIWKNEVIKARNIFKKKLERRCQSRKEFNDLGLPQNLYIEAAHIKPVSLILLEYKNFITNTQIFNDNKKNIEEKIRKIISQISDSNNGLLLPHNYHFLYDKNKIWFDLDGTIKFNNKDLELLTSYGIDIYKKISFELNDEIKDYLNFKNSLIFS